ncbi:MAG: PD40 domain-containing protein [Bacteroidia bacterium]|nr:PD40 domain-containing protein [Bacteroidia bacterium]
MKNLLIIILIINAFLNICYSQSNIKSKFIDAEFDFLYEEYDKALSKYLYLYNRDSLNANVCYRIGLCYLNLPEKTKAIPFLEKAIQKITDDYREGSYSEINAPVDAFLYLGHAYRIDNRFDKAIESFNKYKINLKVEDVYDIELAEHEIEKCRNAKKYLISPLTVGFKNLKLPINDELNNSWVCITPDEKNLVYTTSKAKDVIFYCEWIGDTRWSAPINISFSIKSTGFFKSVNLSHNGNNLLLYTGDNESGDIYICEKKNNKWQPMKEFPKAINSKYKESGACLSPDGNKLYFSSARPGGSGGFDLYISTFSKGTWSAPVNLGPTINTKYNEDMPYLMPDNITLYFSSEGHDNLGGYDIFYSKKIDEEWSTPLNAGYPISTPGDDIYFKPIKNGEAAYVVKYDTSGYGGLDIFSMTIAPPKKVYTVEMQGLLANNEDSVVYEKKQLFSSDSTIEIQKLIAKADSQNVKEKLSLPVDSAIKITSDSTYLAQTQEKA